MNRLTEACFEWKDEEAMEAENAGGDPEEAVYAVSGGEAVKLEVPDDTDDAKEEPEGVEYD